MVWFKLLNSSTTFKNREIPSSKLGSSLLFKVRSVSLWACFSWHHRYSQVTESPLRRSGPLWFALLSTIPCYFPPGLSHSLKPCPTFYAFGLLACVKDHAQVLYLTPVPIYLPPKWKKDKKSAKKSLSSFLQLWNPIREEPLIQYISCPEILASAINIAQCP